jgi:hypothetical protein
LSIFNANCKAFNTRNQFKKNKLGILDVELEITLRQCIVADEIGSSN